MNKQKKLKTRTKDFILLHARANFSTGTFEDVNESINIVERELGILKDYKTPSEADFIQIRESSLASIADTIEDAKKRQADYAEMLDIARNWEPPTDKYNDLKASVVERLASHAVDKSAEIFYESVMDEWHNYTYEGYVERQDKNNKDSILHYEDRLRKLEKVDKKDGWLDKLSESLDEL